MTNDGRPEPMRATRRSGKTRVQSLTFILTICLRSGQLSQDRYLPGRLEAIDLRGPSKRRESSRWNRSRVFASEKTTHCCKLVTALWGCPPPRLLPSPLPAPSLPARRLAAPLLSPTPSWTLVTHLSVAGRVRSSAAVAWLTATRYTRSAETGKFLDRPQP